MHHLTALINLIGLFLVEMFFLAEVKVGQDAPAMMQAGQEVRVTVTVEKADLSGFAKLQLDLPTGLTATAIETKGASFTFADQKAKYIWMALPSQPKFQVSYTLRAEANASGSMTIAGRLSYIEDNERKTYELPSATVQVAGNDLAMSPGKPTPTATTAATIQEAVENTVSPEPAGISSDAMDDVVTMDGVGTLPRMPTAIPPPKAITLPLIPEQQGKGDVRATRTITSVGPTELLVEVQISKGNLRGFGKLQEAIPVGFTALERASDEAIFTAQGTIVKFVWLNLPARTDLKVAYKLRSNSATTGSFVVNGEFGYLLNDETQKAVVGSTPFTLGGEPAVAQEQPKATTPPSPVVTEPEKKPEPVVTEAPKREPEPPANTTAQKPTPPARTSRVPAPENGVSYKVQISAAHREVGKAYFQERHHFSGEFSIERHEGWIKYTAGRFGQYREARDQRNSFVSAGYEFPGPFVTAYNNGERITVQEALMLSNQRWVQ